MRAASEDLSNAVLAAARDALSDLQLQTMSAMREVLGEEVMDAVTGKADPLDLINQAESRFKMSVDEAMTQLDAIRRQGGY